MLKFAVALIIVQYFIAHSSAVESLHDLMTDDELAYYFQTENRNLVPDYEVVYLPVVLHVKEALGQEQMEEIEYNFSAFQR